MALHRRRTEQDSTLAVTLRWAVLNSAPARGKDQAARAADGCAAERHGWGRFCARANPVAGWLPAGRPRGLTPEMAAAGPPHRGRPAAPRKENASSYFWIWIPSVTALPFSPAMLEFW